MMQIDNNKLSTIAMDHQNFICYMSDMDTYELLYLNKLGRDSFGITSDEDFRGKKCYAVLQGKDSPCEFCNNKQLLTKTKIEWEIVNEVVKKRYSLVDTYFNFANRKIRMEIATDISEQHAHITNLESSLTAEQTLVRCIQTLVGDKSIEDAINEILAIIGAHYASDRAYIFDLDYENNVLHNTFEWCGKGVTPQIDKLQNADMAHIGTWLERFNTVGEFSISNLDEEYQTDSPIYEVLKQQGIDSLLTAPLVNNGTIVGFIGVDNPKFNKKDVNLLRSISIFILDDLNKQKILKHLETLSYIDPMTELFNRHKYHEVVTKFEKKPPAQVGILNADINGLRQINDLYGHSQGDYVITKVANLLRKFFSEHVYRLSGDEFIVLYPDIDEGVFEELVYALRVDAVDDPETSFSIGTVWKKGGINILKEVNYADELMHVEKQNYYKKTFEKKQQFKVNSATNLIKEIEDNRFSVYLQGQVDLNTGAIIGAEALVRKFDENGKIVPPLKFIPVYEYERIIRHVDFFVLSEVCKSMKKYIALGHALRVSINFSRITLMEHNVVDSIIAICKEYDIPHHLIYVEITESIDKMDNDILERKILALKSAGFSVSLDDFGTQYSNLSILMTSDFNEVKLDKSLVDNICMDEKNAVIIENSIKMLKELKTKEILAEGVENKEQADLLKKYHCNHGQGYYFYKPMPIEEFFQTFIASKN